MRGMARTTELGSKLSVAVRKKNCQKKKLVIYTFFLPTVHLQKIE